MELSKKNVMQVFQKNPEEYWKVDLFEKEGFVRKQCPKCKKFFWTLDKDREFCADSSCVPYSFIDDTITNKSYSYTEMWEEFQKHFKQKSHSVISRYSVIDRWRPDLFFTIASIQDFQRIDNGRMTFEYPKNPLIVPQICLRFGDIENVGITGRHLTSFCMTGQHSFNFPKEGYFKDKTIEYMFGFLTEVLKIPKKEILFTEDIWAMPDFSSFGPCLEFFSRGLEIANAVFTEFEKSDDPSDEIDGIKFRPLKNKVIDVGWGHERLVWFANGTTTAYDSIFGPMVKEYKEKLNLDIDMEKFFDFSKYVGSLDLEDYEDETILEQEIDKILLKTNITKNYYKTKIKPLQAFYAILDHTRTLLFAITDGGIPSNVGGGYNLRVILRRSLNFIEKNNFDIDLVEIAKKHADFLESMYPELKSGLSNFEEIIQIEKEKYEESKKNAKKILKKYLKKYDNSLPEEVFVELYTSNGVSPDLIREVNPDIKIPSKVFKKIIDDHQYKKERKKGLKKENLAKTEVKDEKELSDEDKLDIVNDYIEENSLKTERKYYDDYRKTDFKTRVIGKKFDFVITDSTYFYPTMGGQMTDTGLFKTNLGQTRVISAISHHDVVLHKVENPDIFEIGEEVEGIIDIDRRIQLTQNHTAAHVLNGAVTEKYGNIIWQAGSNQDEEKSRLDVTYFGNVELDEMIEIEKRSNEIIKESIDVEHDFYERSEAENKFGFKIYQGGAPAARNLRIVNIPDLDVEACGGTHVNNTSEIEKIRILRSTKVQDGVIRFEYIAGRNAKLYDEKEKEIIEKIKDILGSRDDQIIPLAEKLFVLWKKTKKAVKKKKSVDLNDFNLKTNEKKIIESEKVLPLLADILKTQKQHVLKTIERFKKDYDSNLTKLGEIKND